MNTECELERPTPMPVRFSLGDCALVTVWLLLIFSYAVFLTTQGYFGRDFLDAAVFGGALLCVGLGRSRIAYVAGIAIPLFGLAVWFHVPALNAGLLALGFGGVAMLTFCAIRGSQADQRNLRIALVLPLFIVLSAFVNDQVVHFTPRLYDAALLRTDFGMSAAIRRWTTASPQRLGVSAAFYLALPAVAALVLAGATGRIRTHLLRALCLAAILSVPCYLLMPAVGPVHVGQPSAWRNCMPSLHLTWAALLWLNARQVWLRWFAFAFMLCTAYATLATGEHYVLDLIAAVPFTWMVQRLSEPRA